MPDKKDFLLPDTYSIDNVEIFSAGKWNGDVYSETDLEQMATAFNETKQLMKPYLKLGHDDEQKLAQADGLPAIGWIDKVKKVGRKLVADFVRIPKKVYELVKSGAYRRVSSEVYFNIDVNGKKYPKLLKAVALLGGDTPAVQDLNDIVALYAKDYEIATYNESGSETKEYRFEWLPVDDTNKNKVEGKTMTPEEMEVLKKQYEEICGKYEALAAEYAKAQEACKKYEEQISQLTAQVKKNELDALKTQITQTVDKLISDKHIAPAEKEQFFTLLYELKVQEGEIKKFKFGDKEHTLEDLVMGIVLARKFEINTEPKSNVGDASSSEDNSTLAAQAKKYAEENKVSYKEALLKVSRS